MGTHDAKVMFVRMFLSMFDSSIGMGGVGSGRMTCGGWALDLDGKGVFLFSGMGHVLELGMSVFLVIGSSSSGGMMLLLKISYEEE